MQKKDPRFLQDIYSKDLLSLEGIHFTPREIDVIACFVNARGTSKTASLLSLSPHTVLVHSRNIMAKLGCNSRDSIIDFVEKSDKLPILREYYVSLTIDVAFTEALKNISKIKNQKNVTGGYIYWQDQSLKNAFMDRLVDDLKHAGIPSVIQEPQKDQLFEITKTSDALSFIFIEKQTLQETPQQNAEFIHINLSEEKNYYSAVFKILRALISDDKLEDIFKIFLKQYAGIEDFSKHASSPINKNGVIEKNEKEAIYKGIEILKNNKWLLALTVFSAVLFFFVVQIKGNKEMHITQDHEEHQALSIRSDLFVPAQSVLLLRPEEISQMNEKFKGREGIQALALVGPGGIGKTTLSRQYAHQQKANVIWEINAETHESLSSSFEDLAQSLAITEKDQKILAGLLETADLTKREKKLIDFVKQHLRAYSDWFLIYDNVNEFQDIHKYFPQDSATWGRGKIVLTTRNNNIQNSKYINSAFKIEELTPTQKLNLFMKIMTNGNIDSFTRAQKEEAKYFLENIPPYPLDISVAAYYLKITNISYDEYLENTRKTNKDFSSVQEKVLKEVGDYTKTRYNIITLSLQHLMNTHKDFSSLLVFISLLDSQNIPRNLLKAYKNDLSIDDFILNLKKYSLITSHSASSSLEGSTFSLHRSTQDISLSYLIKTLNLEKNNQVFQHISEGLENYIDEIVEREDLSKLRLLVSHCEAFLNHSELLNVSVKYIINAELGSIYYFLGHYEKGKQLLEASISGLNDPKYQKRLVKFLIYLGKIYVETDRKANMKKLIGTIHKIYESHFSSQDPNSAQILTSLGDMYDSLGDYEKAKDLLQKSVMINKKYSANYVDMAWTLALLGNVCRKMGDYKEAQHFFEESLAVYKNFVSKDHFKIGWVLVHLGNIYAALEEYERAHLLIDEGVKIYKKYHSEDHPDVAWASGYLGNIYVEIGEYQKAKDFLQKILTIYQRNFEETHGGLLRTKTYLANAYIKLGDYTEAKNILEQVLPKYEQRDDGDPLELARVLQALAEIHFLENHMEISENLMNKALKIFSEHKHLNAFRSLENLAGVYLKKSIQSMDKENSQEAKMFKEKAISFLNQALKVATQHLSGETPSIKRIQLKLKEFE